LQIYIYKINKIGDISARMHSTLG